MVSQACRVLHPWTPTFIDFMLWFSHSNHHCYTLQVSTLSHLSLSCWIWPFMGWPVMVINGGSPRLDYFCGLRTGVTLWMDREVPQKPPSQASVPRHSDCRVASLRVAAGTELLRAMCVHTVTPGTLPATSRLSTGGQGVELRDTEKKHHSTWDPLCYHRSHNVWGPCGETEAVHQEPLGCVQLGTQSLILAGPWPTWEGPAKGWVAWQGTSRDGGWGVPWVTSRT